MKEAKKLNAEVRHPRGARTTMKTGRSGPSLQNKGSSVSGKLPASVKGNAHGSR